MVVRGHLIIVLRRSGVLRMSEVLRVSGVLRVTEELRVSRVLRMFWVLGVSGLIRVILLGLRIATLVEKIGHDFHSTTWPVIFLWNHLRSFSERSHMLLVACVHLVELMRLHRYHEVVFAEVLRCILHHIIQFNQSLAIALTDQQLILRRGCLRCLKLLVPSTLEGCRILSCVHYSRVSDLSFISYNDICDVLHLCDIFNPICEVSRPKLDHFLMPL